MTKSQKLRKLFKEKSLIRLVGAHNGLSAKLVERHNFEGIWASGLEVSTSYAVPDASILTMSDYLAAAASMNDAVSIPIVADCDTGYGNVNNVIQMVKRFEAAGIAGVCIEDKLFPKVNSYIPGRQELASINEFAGKIMAGKETQNTKDFIIFARVEALIAGWGQEEALKRANAYIDAGADGIFIHSKSSQPDEIRSFVKAWKNRAPLIVCPTSYPSLTEREMKKMKIKTVIYANHGIRAAVKNMNTVLAHITKHGITKVDSQIVPMKEIFELQEMPKMKEDESKYLPKDKLTAVILAAGGPKGKIKTFAGDLPIAMLSLKGEPILFRQIKALRKYKAGEITVVRGYQKEKINLPDVTYIDNKDYNKLGMFHSLKIVLDKLNDKFIFSYGDLVYDESIIKKLLESQEDITLVVDKAWLDNRSVKERPDLVKTTGKIAPGPRFLQLEAGGKVLKIGKKIDRNKANGEFIGLALFSKKGLEILKKVAKSVSNKFKNRKFHEAENFTSAHFNDVIQEIINQGYKVSFIDIYKSWLDVDNFQNYQKAWKGEI